MSVLKAAGTSGIILLTLFSTSGRSFGPSLEATSAQIGVFCNCESGAQRSLQKSVMQLQSDLLNWTGFRKPGQIHSSKLGWVHNVQKSIFEIVYPKGKAVIWHLPAPAMQTNNEWVNLQIKNCLNQKISNCPIFAEKGDGTAWLTGNSSTLATAAHTIHHWVKTTLNDNPSLSLAQIRIPVLLYKNKVLVKTSGEAMLDASDSDRSYWTTTPQDTDEDFAKEFIKISLDAPLNAKPLVMAHNTQLTDQSRTYEIGYPNSTHVFAKIGAKDAPGRVLVISSGKPMEVPGYPKQNLNGERLQFTNAEYFGGSGSPVLNSNGQVIGMVIAGMIEPVEASVVLNINWLNANFSKH